MGESDMKLYTSYFYQIRFFPPNLVPLSTALYDPTWYHRNKGKNHVYLDKRGVINGLRVETLHPDESCEDLCSGKPCDYTPDQCKFLKKYRKQLEKIDFDKFIEWCHWFAKTYKEAQHIKGEVSLAFIFHETPDNPCSERVAFQQWFRDHNMVIDEFKH